MKKVLLSIMLLGFSTFAFVSAGNITVNSNVTNPYGQCIPSQSKDIYYYIPNENVKYWPYDNITTKEPAILVASKTKVDIWNPNALISWCSDWSTIGNITPGKKQWTLAFHNFDGCIFSKPNYTKVGDPNKLDAQIHYSVAFWTLNNTSPNQATAPFAYTTKAWFDSNPRQYTCYPSGKKVAKPNECPRETLKYQKVNNDAEYHNGECLNYRVFWCGDGLLNRPDGSTTYTNGTAIEKCDPNDPNKVGWGNAGCNASCQPINNESPVCKSDYNGKTLDNLTGGNHLCEKGTYSDFKFANNTWTWKCNGQAGTTPVDCSATKNDKVYDLALTKVISAETPAPYQTGSTVKFLITVINQGNYIAKNIEVTDYLPDGLELDDAGWTNAGAGKVVKTLTQEIAPGQSVTVTLQTKISANFTGEKIRNLAEISKDNSADYNTTDKDSTPDSNMNNDCFRAGHLVTGNGKLAQAQGCSDATDEDDHDGVDFTVTPKTPEAKYDLALTKKIFNPKATYLTGERLSFEITLYNQGNKEAKNIEVTDYLPDGLELDDATWTNAGGGKITQTLTQTILPNREFTLMLRVKISENFTGTEITNYAEISKDNSGDYNTTDVDSTPDNNSTNDCFREWHLVTGNGKLAQAQGCSDTTDEDDHDGVKILLTTPKKPNIKKELTGPAGHRYAVGELVGFKMPFKNPHNVQINNVSVRDYLPQNLEYVSSEIHGVTPYVSGHFMSGAVQVVEYSGFNLAPLQEGYLLLTGRVKADYLDQRINLVQILVNKIVVDHDTKWYPLKDRALTIEKVVDKRVLATGEVATFTIKVSVTTGSYTGLTVVDTLPAGLVYDNAWQLTGTRPNMETISFATGKNNQNLDTLTWKFKFPDTIKTGESFQIEMKTKLTESSKTVYTNKACVENPDGNPPEYCDPEDVVPKRPGGDLSIKKYINKVLADAGREDVEMTGFAQWQTGYFTLEVRDARVGLTGFVVSDVVEWNLQYLDSKDLANNAFTGEFIRATANTGAYTYTVNVDVQNLPGNKTKLEWKVTMTSGQFLPGDVYKIKFKVKVNGDQKNIGVVKYVTPDHPNGEDEDDATPRVVDLKLLIKKYVSSAQTGAAWDDNSMQFSNGSTAFFKLEIKDASKPLSGFIVKDRIEGNLQYLDSTDLSGNAFTGVITFGPNNPTHPAYTIVPTVSGTHPTDIQWNVNMGTGAFMPGDVLNIILKAKKNGDQVNTGRVEYPLPWGGTGHSQDPAAVTTPGGGGWGWWGWWGGWGWWGWWGGWWYNYSCGNGVKDWGEICDWGGSSHRIENGYLFKNENIKDDSYNWYTCTSNCRLQKDGITVAPKCFDLENGSISIMKWEVLPFYWNMESQLGFTGTPEKKTQQNAEYLRQFFTMKCSDNDAEWKIALNEDNSFQCVFKVYGPGKQNSNPLYYFEVPCVGVNGWNNGGSFYSRIQSFVNQNKSGWFGGSELANFGSMMNVFATLDNWSYPTLFPLSSKLAITNFGTSNASFLNRWQVGIPNQLSGPKRDITQFGEYKIALEEVKYKKCDRKDKDWKVVLSSTVYKTDDRVCEVDFAVTDPYLIQKSPYGIWNKATADLNKYKLKNGESFMGSIFPTSSISTTAYSVPAGTENLFRTFKNKYSKIAKSVSGNSNLLKVPWKSIYIYKGDVALHELFKDSMPSKPFTLIADGNITIKDTLNTNAMIMTPKKIIFDATNSCNGNVNKYGHAGQMVKGIFYAGEWFESSWDGALKNIEKNLNNWQWCNYGNLHIKWVAIWDLSKVVAARRSELYTWFKWTGWGKVWAEKKDIVINGASVLVEYNPDLWGNLPPGANEFNKVLEVYRK